MVGFYPKGEVEENTVWRCEPDSERRYRASLSRRWVISRIGARFLSENIRISMKINSQPNDGRRMPYHEYKPRIALMKCDKRLPGRKDDGYSSK